MDSFSPHQQFIADYRAFASGLSEIFRIGKDVPGSPGFPMNLHQHQREATEVARGWVSYVLTTGTGSGKSLRYVMDTFGPSGTKILNIYDALAKAIKTGEPCRTVLDPPSGHGPRHPARPEEG